MAMTLNTVNTITHTHVNREVCIVYMLKERWPKIHDESIWQLRIARIQVILLKGDLAVYTPRAEVNYHDYLVERRHSLPEQWARVESVYNRHAIRTPVRVLLWHGGWVVSQGGLLLLGYPDEDGRTGNCQAPARGRAKRYL